MIYVLDTNIILNNPSLSDYKGKTVYIPIAVMKELDNQKTRDGEVGFKSRLFHRKLKEVENFNNSSYDFYGVNILNPTSELEDNDGKEILIADDWFVSATILQKDDFIAHTSDFSCFNLMRLMKKNCEYINNTNIVSNLSLLYKGHQIIYVDSDVIDKVYSNGYCTIEDLQQECTFNENECVTLKNYSSKQSVMSKFTDGRLTKLKFNEQQSWWGLQALSEEQKYALSLLSDENIRIVTLTGEAGSSKAQPNNTPVPTPTGWKTIGDLKVNDYVFDRTGKITKVLGVYPQGIKPTYRITFSDGRSTLCADEHLWDIYTTKTKAKKHINPQQKPMELTTLEIIEKLNKMNKNREGKKRKWLYIQNNGAVEYDKKELPIDPYSLGVLLGDGCLTCSGLQISSNEEDIIKKVATKLNLDYKKYSDKNYTWYLLSNNKHKIKKSLKEMGLLVTADKKHIPPIYLESSIDDRLELLKGLMDTDGTVGKKNRLSFSTTSEQLKNDFVLLCRSLGFITSICKPTTKDRNNALYTICIQTNEKIFSSLKHEVRWQQNISMSKEKIGKYYNDFIAIQSIEQVEKQENTCIYVDNDEHLYLTENYIVTHNTILSFAVGLETKVNNFGKGKLYIAKPPVPLSNRMKLGYKKGDLLAKAIGTLGGYATNLERLSNLKGENRKLDGTKMLMDLIEQCDVNYLNLEDILGMSFSDDDYIIIDEAELLTKDEMKTILTRGGKMIIIGDIDQQCSDNKIDADKSGLLHLIEVGKSSKLIAHLTLEKVYRSKMVEEINKIW